MTKTKYDIEREYQKKIDDMVIKEKYKATKMLENFKKRQDGDYERRKTILARKLVATINKKSIKYKRDMQNKIRKLDGKPPKGYATPSPIKKELEFAMSIAQENAKLRDTNADGYGYCVSCNHLCSWKELAGGHRYSRRFTTMCLEIENINAQCHKCNWTTGPRGNPAAKVATNMKYDENLIKKYGKGITQKLKDKVYEFTQGKAKKYDLDVEIPKLIEENESLWATKNFFSPKKKWRNLWDLHIRRR